MFVPLFLSRLALVLAVLPAGSCGELEDDVLLLQNSFKRHVVPGGLIVPLDLRHGKRPWRQGNATSDSVFYTANISVGSPAQKFNMLVDTGSGFVILPHRRCTAKSCRMRRQYSSQLSRSAEEVYGNGTNVNFSQRLVTGRHQRTHVHIPFNNADMGNGYCQGTQVRDRVCVFDANSEKLCAKPVLVTALNMDEIPFRYMPGDGILGLSLSGLSLDTSQNFLDNLIASEARLKPQFGLSFGKDGGELHVGGYDPAVVANPLLWFPVFKPEEGQWQVLINSVKVGGLVIDLCEKGCRAVVDTGTSRIGVQDDIRKSLQEFITTLTPSDRTDASACPVPQLTFDLGGIEIVLGAEDYINEKCEPDLGDLDLEEPQYQGVYTFGAQVLRKYFIAFDWKHNMMGFASTTGAKREIGTPAMVEQTFV
jgi:hypothetical protein